MVGLEGMAAVVLGQAGGDVSQGESFTVAPDAGMLVWTGVLLLAVVAVVVWVFRSRRAGLAINLAYVLMTVVRVGLLGLVVLGGVAVVTDDDSVSFGPEVSGIEREPATGAFVIEATAVEASALCPLRRTRSLFGSDPVERTQLLQVACRTSKLVEAARPPRLRFRGYRLDARIERPTAADRRTLGLLGWAGLSFVILGMVALERVLSRIVQRRPFDAAVVWWLRGLALSVAGAGWLVTGRSEAWIDGLLRRVSGEYDGPVNIAQLERVHDASGFAALFIAGLVLVLAELWRVGASMREEAEATI